MTQTNTKIQGGIRSGDHLTSNSDSMEKTSSVAMDDMLLPVEMFIEEHYQLRRNVLSGMVEYKKSGEDDDKYVRLTTEEINTIIIKAKRELEGEKHVKEDIKAYLSSSIPPVYNPVKEWLGSLPVWDGKDYVEPFINRIPGLTDEHVYLMKIWLRSVVAHWMGIDHEHGNETVPMLIGAQGCGKSTYCVRLLPEHLRQYYLDHFNLANKFDKEMALSGCLLICLDEVDQYKASQMAELKQALSKVKVTSRKIYGRTIDERERTASFIATTNNRHPLVDLTGSRRYITLEIAKGKKIDNASAINYDQLYAQLLHEVMVEHKRYWFTEEETIRLQELNAPYQQTDDLELMIDHFYRKPDRNEKGESLTSLDIRKKLQKEFPNVPSTAFTSIKIGKALKEMKVSKVKSRRGVSYALISRAA